MDSATLVLLAVWSAAVAGALRGCATIAAANGCVPADDVRVESSGPPPCDERARADTAEDVRESDGGTGSDDPLAAADAPRDIDTETGDGSSEHGSGVWGESGDDDDDDIDDEAGGDADDSECIVCSAGTA